MVEVDTLFKIIEAIIIILGVVSLGWFRLASNTIKLQKDQIKVLEQKVEWQGQEMSRMRAEIDVFRNVPLKEIAQGVESVAIAQKSIVETQKDIINLIGARA